MPPAPAARNYLQPFVIAGPVGNNAFSYERRGSAPQLWGPPLVTGTFDDVKPGERVVFEDFDEHGVLQSCPGLSHLVRTVWDDVPVVIVDNHNHAFYFWMEALAAGVLGPNATLIHVDQHKDMRVPERDYQGSALEDAFTYTNFHLNVGNYIVPAQRAGLVGEMLMVTGEDGLRDFGAVDRANKILNIDLDFFAPEMAYIDFELTRGFLTAQRRTASLITIATSPFFVEQERAIAVLRTLTR